MTRVSFIIPAFNEEQEIVATLRAIRTAVESTGVAAEAIVVDDGSTDATARLAEQEGATVVRVQKRQISAVRNAGARHAAGSLLVFVDADTRITPDLLKAVLTVASKGAVGGGSTVRFFDSPSKRARVVLAIFVFFYSRLVRWAAGCFVFAQRADFDAVGGFDETIYVAEEIVLSRALKRRGRFVVLSEPAYTSSRKLQLYTGGDILRILWRFARHGRAMMRDRSRLGWWYDGRRSR